MATTAEKMRMPASEAKKNSSPLSRAWAGRGKGQGFALTRAIATVGEVDAEARRVPVCISTDTPEDRGAWKRILVHTPEAVVLDSITNRNLPAPFLLDHDRYNSNMQIGAIDPESVVLSGGKLRAEVVMASGELADRMLADIANGIRRQISVGARVWEYEEDRDTMTERATRWEPMECSLVTVAADMEAGVARNKNLGDNAQTEVVATDGETSQMPNSEINAEQREKIRKEYEAELQERDTSFDEIVSSVPEQHRLKAAELVSKARTKGEDAVQWLQKEVIALLGVAVSEAAEAAEAAQTPAADAGAVERAQQAAAKVGDAVQPLQAIQRAPAFLTGNHRFSVAKAIADYKNGAAQTGMEREVTDTLYKKHMEGVDGEEPTRRSVQGIMLPNQAVALDALRHRAITDPRVQRLLQDAAASRPDVIQKVQDGTATAGLLNESLLPNLYVQALRPMARIMDWGVQVLQNLRENIALPEQTGVTAGQWLAVNGQVDPTQTEADFGDINLRMKTFAAIVQFPRGVLKQSRPAVDQLVANDLMRTIGIAIQDAALTGTGTNNQPTGITNESAVVSQTIAASTGAGTAQVASPTRGEILGLLGSIADENASMENGRWVMRPSRFFSLKQTPIDAGSGLFLVDRMDGMLEGYPVETYSQLNSNTFIFGNFSDMVLGFWGEEMEYRSDIHVAGGGRHDRIYCDMDVALRYRKAFGVASAT